MWITTWMLRLFDGEWSASSDLRKGNTEGSVSRPQLNNRHTEMFFSKAECFSAFSMTGQYLCAEKHITLQHIHWSYQIQPNCNLVLMFTRADERTWKQDNIPWQTRVWTLVRLWWLTEWRQGLVCESLDRTQVERPEEHERRHKLRINTHISIICLCDVITKSNHRDVNFTGYTVEIDHQRAFFINEGVIAGRPRIGDGRVASTHHPVRLEDFVQVRSQSAGVINHYTQFLHLPDKHHKYISHSVHLPDEWDANVSVYLHLC